MQSRGLTSVIQGSFHSVTVQGRIHKCCGVVQVRDLSNFSSHLLKGGKIHKKIKRAAMAYIAEHSLPPKKNSISCRSYKRVGNLVPSPGTIGIYW